MIAAGTVRRAVSCEECWLQQSENTVLLEHTICHCPLPICLICINKNLKQRQLFACSGCDKSVTCAAPIKTFEEYLLLGKQFWQQNKPSASSQRIYSLCKSCLQPTAVWARHLLCRDLAGQTKLCYNCAIRCSNICSGCNLQIDCRTVSPAIYFIET